MKKLIKLYFYTTLIISLNINFAKSEIAFSFDKVNLISVMNLLSAEIDRNISIEENIDAKISLIISHPISEKKVISTLQNSLMLNDLVLIEKENGDLLIKNNLNLKVDAPVSKKGVSGFQIFIVNLQHVSPNLMAPFLSQFFSELNTITPSPNGKSLTFIGNENDYKRLINLINKFDVKAKIQSYEIKLKNSKSSEITNVLQKLIDEGNWLLNPTNEVSVVNLEKLNSIYINAPKNSLNQIKDFVNDLDKIKLETKSNKLKNTSKLNDDQIIKNKPTIKNEFGFEVITLKHANSSEIQQTLNNIISNSNINNDNNSLTSNNSSIQSYLSGNQVIISGNDKYRGEIVKLIEILDQPIKQVFVEAIVAELSTSKAKELGLQFSGSSGKVGLTVLNKNSLSANISSSVNSFVSDGIGITLGPGSKQISSIGALINVIENDGNSEILATPTLLAMNNREAQILVGSNIPIITGKYTQNSPESATSPFQTISRQDVGIIFKIKPVIGMDGYITIEMQQEVSELDTSSALASDVVTTKRAIATSAVVKTGRTVAVGGLINETTQFLGAKIPILGDLPGIKELFNQRRVSTSKRNLVIFLKPSIVNNDVISKHTLERYMKLKNELEKSRSNNYFDIDYPPLPLIEGF